MSLLTTILTFPFHVLTSILRFLFQTLRIPIPSIPLPFSSLSFYRPLPASDPYSVADRWVRALEDETGAQCLSRTSATAEPGSSTGSELRQRHPAARLTLPDFMLSSYEDALKACQTESRVGCIVLVSDEHDDVPDFKRHTLTDPAFVDVLHKNNFIVWGGDVREREAWSAARKLQATTYPFVAFVALQPPRPTLSGTRPSSQAAALTILSRHQGPPANTTSARTLTDHINTQLLPRVGPFLARLRAQQREREAERALRAEQDRAFHESARRDAEKAAMRAAEEKAAEEARREEERRAREAEERRRSLEARRTGWRRTARAALIGTEATGADALRVVLRLPDGQRLIRAFAPSTDVGALYAFVDEHFHPSPGPKDNDDAMLDSVQEGPLKEMVDEAGGADAWWGFKLFLAYPRSEVVWTSDAALGDVKGLERGGQVVVEPVAGQANGKAAEREKKSDGDDDGYDTEDSE
ncbi:hypothetical protein FA95DRAFT_1560847 [Auriscalpium vulgare]|uniref:Uncharacterized protein n=1 Tax=Auriscalpium vulgare TaxID=40419 RepID=A0ACB8RQ80_9AGAM|nr:hypothetical protein FA95DRAFT_1560847 [Auriscalpium vulgare]